MTDRPTPKEILDDPRYLYTSRPGLGRVAYVFSDKLCLGEEEALAHVRGQPIPGIAEHELSSPTGLRVRRARDT